MALPTPTGRQREVLCLPAEGHTVVLGTAGSGKTTLAILRSANLSDPGTDHSGPTLLVTFNRALVAYLRHLRDRQLDNVFIENYHTFARGCLSSHGISMDGTICSKYDERKEFITRAVQQVADTYKPHPFFKRHIELFSDEIRWIAQHGIRTLDEYVTAERIGRSGTRIDGPQREAMFSVYEAYRALRAESGKHYDWDDMAVAVSDVLDSDAAPRRYRHIVIDEGQDFSPEMIRSLVKAVPPDGSVTFFGDVAQQIYGHRMTWRSAGLNVQAVWEFRDNFRNTKQIARLALAISRMPYFRDIPDIVEPTAPAADGALPTLVRLATREDEISLAVKEAIRASKTLSVGILLRNHGDVRSIAAKLPKGCIKLDREMSTWESGPGIYYGTYHSAKGLEFDTVILPFCTKQRLPDPESVEAFGEEDAVVQDGRLLYVGVTRARTRLVITYHGEISSLLPEEAALYERL